MMINPRDRNGFFTTYTIKYPFDQCVDTIGRNRVAVWANDKGLPLTIMSHLQTAFARSNRDLRELMHETVRESEKAAIPLACIILGKA